MAILKKAVILLDDTEKTGSTGGIVVDVFKFNTDLERNPLPFDENDKKYMMMNCSNDCQPGWIYTSKTHMLVDSNKPPK